VEASVSGQGRKEADARVTRAERLAREEELLVRGRLNHVRIEILKLLRAEERKRACMRVSTSFNQSYREQTHRVRIAVPVPGKVVPFSVEAADPVLLDAVELRKV
jgi:hypothetical protein